MAKVLLIETDRQLAKNIQGYLKLAGHSIQIHSDLQTAITSADTQSPDIIVLDLWLAGRSGIEFLYELRSYPDWQNVPVIVTGKLSQDELALYDLAFQQLNVASYLPKHATISELASQIGQLLQPANA
ncbi:MAG: response regulator transcription factor [Candidatus Saccharimonadales bacterium]